MALCASAGCVADVKDVFSPFMKKKFKIKKKNRNPDPGPGPDNLEQVFSGLRIFPV
jgi:hypothetical protein